MMETVRTSETSVDNYFTRQYIPEDNSEPLENLFVSDHSLRVEHNLNPGPANLTSVVKSRAP
jgi:hypothetical protein